jgi:hypothetical protein
MSTVQTVPLTTVLEQNPITSPDMVDGREMLNGFRAKYGMGGVSARVNMLKANGKLALDTGADIKAFGLSLNPSDTHGEINTCLWSTAGCRAACVLDFAYQRADNVRNSRRAVTDYLYESTADFVAHLMWEISELVAKHGEGNVAIRLNVASDIRWERISPIVFDTFGEVVHFYDYTKAPFGQRDLRDDYTIVFSVSERAGSVENARKYIAAGHSATIVLPIRYRSHTNQDDIPAEIADMVADHDKHDVRALDKGKLGVLRAKASARTDKSGFVRDIAEVMDILA